MRRLIEARASRKWESSEKVREDARLHMRYLVGLTHRASEVDELAQRYVAMQIQCSALQWRPWLVCRQPIAHVAQLLEAHERRRGAIVNFFHHGQFDGVSGSLGRAGVRVRVAGARQWFAEDRPRAAEQLRRNCEMYGAEMFNVWESGYAAMAEMLRRGDSVFLASDMPGRTEMTVLGRRVRAASGAARLSVDLRVPIFPIHARQDGPFQRLTVGEPIDPAGISDFRQIQEEIGRRHEAAILAWPEAMYAPLHRWTPADPEDAAEFGYDDGRLNSLCV